MPFSIAGWQDTLSLLLVGAVWGCTNPFLRNGSNNEDNSDKTKQRKEVQTQRHTSKIYALYAELIHQFQQPKVFIPYLLNQSGSLLYYYLLATSDLTLAVPICNGLALAFTFVTSYYIGEPIDQPVRSAVGAMLVTTGVGICMISRDRT
mmetsp:Transcript_10478/g.12753  ORF Transcript_10478/g.12753 Transcript_10478/m.12753 type:complete len:149 (+) Transcript_10478:53-499(+)|eukprot:CAMPEP_0194364314 /NCGR_PEP_ID=MMETSP0174-20130528/12241_1 /TAXON_ID=216777 /ORGANISM="Proboscia alata, Strain PI-D3" /LENGTH=148 /DNA_ID=CAMNT_0039138289 /DNA_START=53 /DNA_END=499 /DNA_ORIENTATION=+